MKFACKSWKKTGLAAVLWAVALPATAETLHYSINWPSGLSLGEATLRSEMSGGASEPGSASGWNLSLTLDAAVPGFVLRDEYHAASDSKFCLIQLDKTVTRGSRKTVEKVTFDSENRVVRRATQGGGKSEYSAPACIHDALTFVQFVRQELAQGRIAPSQPVVLGAKYDLQLSYTGAESIRRGGEMVTADRVHVIAKGPKSEVGMDLYFGRDNQRTLLLAQVPLALGTFSVELLP